VAHTDRGPAGSRQEQLQAQLRTQIKDAARRQLAAGGIAGLSLRGISRQLGLSVGGIYRYYPTAQVLLTALSQDAYAGLGEAVIRACAAVPADQHRQCFLTFCHAYHGWARAHPVQYELIYGRRPAADRLPAAVRIDAALDFRTLGFRILADAVAGNTLDPARATLRATVHPTAELTAALDAVHIRSSPELVALALTAWAALHGIVTLDLAGVPAQLVADPDELLDAHLQALATGIGFPDPRRARDAGQR
jgi:AcrR family transcriptional regulator